MRALVLIACFLLTSCQHTPLLWIEVGGSCRGERVLLEAQIVRLQERIDELKHLIEQQEGRR